MWPGDQVEIDKLDFVNAGFAHNELLQFGHLKLRDMTLIPEEMFPRQHNSYHVLDSLVRALPILECKKFAAKDVWLLNDPEGHYKQYTRSV